MGARRRLLSACARTGDDGRGPQRLGQNHAAANPLHGDSRRRRARAGCGLRSRAARGNPPSNGAAGTLFLSVRVAERAREPRNRRPFLCSAAALGGGCPRARRSGEPCERCRRHLLRAQAIAVFVFGATSLLLFSFAIGPSAALRQYAGGFLWLGLLLSSTLTLSESFHAEMENRALEGLLLLPVSARVLYYGKALANTIQLVLLGIALVPVMVVLYDAGTTRIPTIVLIILLGSAGISAPGTLYSAMTSQARAKQTLLPLLLFPLIVPVLLASVKATSLAILGDPMGQGRSWIALLTAFNGIYWSLCGLLFDRVVED